MKKKLFTILIAVIMLFVLFFPFLNHTFKDGGTTSHSALTYKIVNWHRFTDDGEAFEKTRIYIFPYNFKSIDELWELEKAGKSDKASQCLEGMSITTSPFEYFSDVEGILMQPFSFNFECEKPYIEVKWRNLRDTEYCIGECFDILYAEDEGDNAESCAIGDLMITYIGIIIPAGGEVTMKYEIDKFDLSKKDGIYSILSCAAHMENGDELNVGFKFRLTDKPQQTPINTGDEIDKLIKRMANPDDTTVMLSSNPWDYIRYSIEDYNHLVNSGDFVLEYCVNKLKTTGANGLEGYIMACACSDISGIGSRFDPDAEWATAQEWLDIYKTKTIK